MHGHFEHAVLSALSGSQPEYSKRMGAGSQGVSGALRRHGKYYKEDVRSGPVIVGANWYRFRSGEHIRHEHVESVSFVWVVHGSGTITSGGESFVLTSNSIVRLPWKHNVDYRPDAHAPFRLGTIHLIPEHDASVPVEFRVGFEDGDPLLGATWRRGATDPSRPIAMSSLATSARNVITLASYCIERFLVGRTNESSMRALASLIVEESSDWGGVDQVAQAVPTVLELMIDHVVANLDQPLTVAEIARAGRCSTTTAERMFARYTGLSVLSWSRRRRMQEAALLLRTSGLRVNEVARRVGYVDPLYFSRVFSAIHAVPPSQYAKEQLRP
jgi:AraC-like DNA-binding protein/mannose-6-phosphate isomerase-like protein (cupin superfamily)